MVAKADFQRLAARARELGAESTIKSLTHAVAKLCEMTGELARERAGQTKPDMQRIVVEWTTNSGEIKRFVCVTRGQLFHAQSIMLSSSPDGCPLFS